ncbi:hypothetical protein [Tropicimonas sp. S265A]|uniref:hypothetical protein n=1 Tax=Tropicimonas sp. S265A TaxID=3415134 RepID=UPI003C7977AE
MSAPDTNIEKQAKRHKPSLWGMAVAAMVPLVVIVAALLWGDTFVEDDATDRVTVEEAQ